MSMDARQFDGTFGNAKEIAAWVGEKACAGATEGHTDDKEGGLNLVGTDASGAPEYTTVYPTDWVVQRDDKFVAMTNEQFRVAFPDF